jgi:hypothetical protein
LVGPQNVRFGTADCCPKSVARCKRRPPQFHPGRRSATRSLGVAEENHAVVVYNRGGNLLLLDTSRYVACLRLTTFLKTYGSEASLPCAHGKRALVRWSGVPEKARSPDVSAAAGWLRRHARHRRDRDRRHPSAAISVRGSRYPRLGRLVRCRHPSLLNRAGADVVVDRALDARMVDADAR